MAAPYRFVTASLARATGILPVLAPRHWRDASGTQFEIQVLTEHYVAADFRFRRHRRTHQIAARKISDPISAASRSS